MREDREALIRRAFSAFADGDIDAVLRVCDESIVVVEPPDRPDGETRHGHDGVRDALAGWPDLWDDYRAEIVRMTEVGDHVVVLTHQHARGKGSGVEVESLYTFVFTIRDRRLIAWRMFSTEEEAMEALSQLE